MVNRVISPALLPTSSIFHSVLSRNAFSQRFFFFSVGLTTSPLPLSKTAFEHWKSDSYSYIFTFEQFLYLYALAEIKCLFASRFLCVFPLCCYLYSHSAEKEPLTLTQIENMPSSYFCVSNPSSLHMNASPLCNCCSTVFFKQDFMCLYRYCCILPH